MASGMPLRVEPPNVESYSFMLTFEKFKYTEIVVPPNTTVRITNNYSVPISLAVAAMEAGIYGS